VVKNIIVVCDKMPKSWLVDFVYFGCPPVPIDKGKVDDWLQDCGVQWSSGQVHTEDVCMDSLGALFSSVGVGNTFANCELWVKPIKLHAFLANSRKYTKMKLVIHATSKESMVKLREDPLGCDLRYAGTRNGLVHGIAVYFALSDHLIDLYSKEDGVAMLCLLLTDDDADEKSVYSISARDFHDHVKKSQEDQSLQGALNFRDVVKYSKLYETRLEEACTCRNNVVVSHCNNTYLPLGMLRLKS
jgi:hypothetical protein